MIGIRLGDGIAMRATSLLLGCLLGLGAVATAAANGSSIAGTMGNTSGTGYNCNNQSSEHGSNHDAVAAGGGDTLSVSHVSSVSSTPSSHRGSTSNSSESDVIHVSDDASPNHSSHGSSLSWQSLLPGSIQ
jgi:hypothetical protein